MLKGTLVSPMVPAYHQIVSPYGKIFHKEVGICIHLFGRRVSELDLNVDGHVSNEITLYSVPNLVNVDMYDDGHRIYAHNNFSVAMCSPY